MMIFPDGNFHNDNDGNFHNDNHEPYLFFPPTIDIKFN